MRCPFCHQDNDKVVDTRTSDDGFVVRRRRTCCTCGKRFTTYERAETTQIRVIKRNGQRVPFDREKLRQGLERACWKRQISDAQISTLIAQVESDIDSMFETEVESQFIGERVMQYLGELDQVAFVRFASVYRHFQAASDFAKDLEEMLEDPDEIPYHLKHLNNSPQLRFSKANKKRN
jgi:transcriptional repressor NrdR